MKDTTAKADPVRAQTVAERLRDGCRDLMAGFMEPEEQRELGRLLYDASLWDHNPLAGLSPASRPAALAQQAGAVPVAWQWKLRAEDDDGWVTRNKPLHSGITDDPACEVRALYVAPQPAIPEWFDDVLRCLQDVATEFRARGRDDRRFEHLASRMLAKRSWEGE